MLTDSMFSTHSALTAAQGALQSNRHLESADFLADIAVSNSVTHHRRNTMTAKQVPRTAGVSQRQAQIKGKVFDTDTSTAKPGHAAHAMINGNESATTKGDETAAA
ncbi:MAG: hypothetical protein HY432_03875 [Candidatus Liptonbacteria bacterium]|nr:hypothetical protein [Candidatus Liptonbacteria bacterium]